MNPRKPRGRPRTFDRDAALLTAMNLFWRHGYEGTSIADLTNALEITPPTLYAAFGSKEQLYRSVLERYLEQSGEARRTRGDISSAYDLIAQYLHTIAQRFTDPSRPAGCMIQTASLNCADEHAAARAATASMRANMLALLTMTLDWARDCGELPTATDTHALARFYTAIVQGMSVQAIDGASADDLVRVANHALAAWPGERPARDALPG